MAGQNLFTSNSQVIRKREILDMASWVALIGMRLPDYNDEEVDTAGSSNCRIWALNPKAWHCVAVNRLGQRHTCPLCRWAS